LFGKIDGTVAYGAGPLRPKKWSEHSLLFAVKTNFFKANAHRFFQTLATFSLAGKRCKDICFPSSITFPL
jgi:hypothetical protein